MYVRIHCVRDYASKSAFYVGLESGSDTKSLFTTSRRWIGGLMLCDGANRVYRRDSATTGIASRYSFLDACVPSRETNYSPPSLSLCLCLLRRLIRIRGVNLRGFSFVAKFIVIPPRFCIAIVRANIWTRSRANDWTPSAIPLKASAIFAALRRFW